MLLFDLPQQALPPAAPQLRIALALVALLAAGCPGGTSLETGDPAPEFELPSLDGATVSSQSLLGRPVVLNFWATWCVPCRSEIPVLQSLEAAGVQVVAIAIDDEGEELVRPFVEQYRPGYTVLLGNGEIFRRFGGSSIPYTLVLDGTQEIVAIHRGLIGPRMVQRDLRRAGG